jgi:hypothetical protein
MPTFPESRKPHYYFGARLEIFAVCGCADEL